MRVRIGKDLLITADDENNALLMAANGKAMSPMKVFLASFGGCTAVDVFLILQKMREEVEEVNVYLDFERKKKHPKIYTKIHLNYVIVGDVKEKNVKKAIKLSEEKYCSISAMLRDEVRITRDYKIIRR